VKFSVDARGTTNAFGYDVAGRRIAATNAWGIAGVAMINLYGLMRTETKFTSRTHWVW
jgi:hypothetical protein